MTLIDGFLEVRFKGGDLGSDLAKPYERPMGCS